MQKDVIHSAISDRHSLPHTITCDHARFFSIITCTSAWEWAILLTQKYFQEHFDNFTQRIKVD